MTVGPAIWLLAPPTVAWADALFGALVEAGARVERLRPEGIEAWQGADGPPAVQVAPQLIVIDAGLALENDARLLNALERSPRWRFLPRVVVSGAADAEAAARAYALGVASFAAIDPSGSADFRPGASVFARYWAQTVMLPVPDYFAP